MRTDFKCRHYRGEIILWAVRWYCRYGISYRDLAEMLEERGVEVDHTTIYRWVQHYAPEMEIRALSTPTKPLHMAQQLLLLSPAETEHRQIKYLSNVIEADHGKLKWLIKPTLGFKNMKTAYAAIKGFEVMRALRKQQDRAFNLTNDIHGETRIIERAFGLGNDVMAGMMHMLENHLKAV